MTTAFAPLTAAQFSSLASAAMDVARGAILPGDRPRVYRPCEGCGVPTTGRAAGGCPACPRCTERVAAEVAADHEELDGTQPQTPLAALLAASIRHERRRRAAGGKSIGEQS